MKDSGIQTPSMRALTVSQEHAAMYSGAGTTPPPSRDQIARRAYDIYLSKGRLQGQCQLNWLQAERELRMSQEASDSDGLAETPSDPQTGLRPVVKTFSGALPSSISGRGPTQGRTTFAPQGPRGVHI